MTTASSQASVAFVGTEYALVKVNNEWVHCSFVGKDRHTSLVDAAKGFRSGELGWYHSTYVLPRAGITLNELYEDNPEATMTHLRETRPLLEPKTYDEKHRSWWVQQVQTLLDQIGPDATVELRSYIEETLQGLKEVEVTTE